MFDQPEVESLDAVACADALVAGVEAQRRAGAERLALAAHFADLHGPGSVAGRRHVRMVPGGSDGTPEVSEFAADELGMLIEQSTRSAGALLRDALDLRHRHPRLWEEVMTGAVDDWKARKVAQVCSVLTQERATWVDEVSVEAVVGLPFGRALGVVEGKVIAADPAGHDARRAAREGERFVRATRSDDSGSRMLYARTTSGDVARLDAMIGHLAGLLQAAGDTDELQRRRAKALALLANPALACVYLADHRPTVTTDAAPVPSDEDPEEPAEPANAVAAARALGEALRAMGTAVVDRLRPRTVLYLHLAEEAVGGGLSGRPGTQVVRTEGFGALTRSQLTEWLGRDRLVVRPVIDLHGQEPADAYEVPTHLREAMLLAHPYEVFPFGTTSSRARSVDADHTRPWVPPDHGGPPGQTVSRTSDRSRADTTARRRSAGSAVTSPCPGCSSGARRPVTGTRWTTRARPPSGGTSPISCGSRRRSPWTAGAGGCASTGRAASAGSMASCSARPHEPVVAVAVSRGAGPQGTGPGRRRPASTSRDDAARPGRGRHRPGQPA